MEENEPFLNFTTVEEGEKKYEDAKQLMNQMVGTLYPSILADTMYKMRLKIADLRRLRSGTVVHPKNF